jgi:hypothetical protein
MITLRGRFIVRQTRSSDGKPTLLLFGIAVGQTGLQLPPNGEDLLLAAELVSVTYQQEPCCETSFQSPEDIIEGGIPPFRPRAVGLKDKP